MTVPRTLVAGAAAALLLAACGDTGADAEAPHVGEAWAPVPPNPDVAAVYLQVGDPGEDDVLLGAETDVAEDVELHRSTVDDEGQARMEHLPDGIEVPAGEGVVLEPGGLHLMLLGPDPLAEGDAFDLVLAFERGGEVVVEVEVVEGHGGPHDDHDEGEGDDA